MIRLFIMAALLLAVPVAAQPWFFVSPQSDDPRLSVVPCMSIEPEAERPDGTGPTAAELHDAGLVRLVSTSKLLTNDSTLIACRATKRGPNADEFACRSIRSEDDVVEGETLYSRAQWTVTE